MKFVWDAQKAAINKRKHGVTFEEAQTVFQDCDALRIFDPDHSEDEDRFLILGLSSVLRLLVVVCVPEECDDWTQQTEEQLCLHHCAYWLSLAGMPETNNAESVTVHIPRNQIFSVEFLREAMRRSANEEVL